MLLCERESCFDMYGYQKDAAKTSAARMKGIKAASAIHQLGFEKLLRAAVAPYQAEGIRTYIGAGLYMHKAIKPCHSGISWPVTTCAVAFGVVGLAVVPLHAQ